MGVVSWPLSNPVSTGASISITFWGLDKFVEETSAKIYNRFVFETKEAVKHPKATFTKGCLLAYAMAMYIIQIHSTEILLIIMTEKQLT